MTEKKRDILQTVDDPVRRQLKHIIRTARQAALGTLDAATGAPSVSRIAIATFTDGAPGFFISALAAHQQNLMRDKRCSLLVGEPGKGDPLAHPRVTLIGEAEMLEPGPLRDAFRARYRSHNSKSKLYQDLPDFSYWRFHTSKASFNGGFGRAFAPEPRDLVIAEVASDEWASVEPGVIEHMNADHAAAVDRYAAAAGSDGTGWRLAGIDPEGLDLIRGDEFTRLWFDPPLASVTDIRPRLVALAKAAPAA